MDNEVTRPGLRKVGGRAGNPYNSLIDPNTGVPVPDEPADALEQELAAIGAPRPVDTKVIGSTDPREMETGTAGEPPISGGGIHTTGSGGSGPGAGKRTPVRWGDRIFGWLTAGTGLLVIALVGLVAVFLVVRAIPGLADDKVNFLTSRQWTVELDNLSFGIVDMLWTTVIVAVIAMVIAVPIAIGIALFITQYAPKRFAKPVAYIIDVLAAIPSIIYGIWGIYVLAPKLRPVREFLTNLDFIPLFKDEGIEDGTVFNAGVVLAIMILPIVTAISRDVFERTPRQNIEAAWALGATRWEMIRLSVLPYGRPGVVSGAMLGLGRALGETIAVMLILSKVGAGNAFSWSIFSGGETFASKIALNAPEFNDPKTTAPYIAAGLVLFVLTFAVNAAARWVVNRRKEFS
jgi:phosphate transport system permease protein